MSDEQTRILQRNDRTGVFESHEPIISLTPGGLEGERIDRYQVGRLIGTGGGSHVYEAYDGTLQRKVALKILFGQERDWTEQALREARAQAKVDHEFVCKVYDVGRWHSLSYIAMQYIDGQPLDEAGKLMNTREKVELMRRILLAVDAAHRRGLIHRDLKPANILVERGASGFWKPYVTDFGLAREMLPQVDHSQSGRVHGTPAYMAPEQAKGESIRDTHSDIYSLGATFYKFLCGQPPFSGTNAVTVMLKVVRESARPLREIDPQLSPELEAIVARAMAKSPEDRFDSAGEFARELTRFLEGWPVISYNGGLRYVLMKRINRHRPAYAIGLGSLLLFSALAGLFINDRLRSRQQALYLERFMDEVQAIQWQLRISHMMPSHDIRPERAAIRERMKRIESDMRRLGDSAIGPGHYALGRAYLELNEPEKARDLLDSAKDNSIWRGQVTYAWGEAACKIYHRRLRSIRRLRDAELRNKAIEDLRKELLPPALEALAVGTRDNSRPRDYIEAQIAYFEGRYDQAIALARKAAESNPWFYEASLLQAEAYTDKGRFEIREGDQAAAHATFEKAAALLERALTIAASDVELYIADCERLTWILELNMRSGNNVEAACAAILARVEQGLLVEPDNALLESYRAFAHYRQAEQLFYYKDQDPQRELELSIASSERCISLSPKFTWGYQYLGHAYSLWNELYLSRGEEGWSLLEQAQQAYQKACEIEPNDVGVLSSLGVVSWQMADIANRRGRNPDTYIKTSLARFKDALAIAPKYYITLNNIALTYWTQAETAMLRGLDSEPSFILAAENFQKAIDINKYDLALANLAEMNLIRAAYQIEIKRDPGPVLEKAESTCHSLIELNNTFAMPYMMLAGIDRLRGQSAELHGLDPESYFQAAAATLKSTSAKLGEQHDLNMEMLRLDLRRGWYLLNKNQSEPGRQLLERALARAAKLDLTADDDERESLVASLNIAVARAKGDRARLASAQEDLTRSFKINPVLRVAYVDFTRATLD